MKTTLTPYLAFDKKTAEAMKFYQAIFGGDLKMQTFAESGMPVEEEYKDCIVHAALTGGAVEFMASDGDREHPVTMGDNVTMSLMGDDEAQLTEFFNKLAEGGNITMPLENQFWGDTYGQLVDKFGVHWAVNISSGEQKEQQ